MLWQRCKGAAEVRHGQFMKDHVGLTVSHMTET